MPRSTCPKCRRPFQSEASPAMPFCSERCRLLDLGGWFEEAYSLPVERDRELDEFKEEPDEPDEE